MVYAQGTRSGSYGGTSVLGGNVGGQWAAGVGAHQGTSFSQTQLAEYCRPPSPPSGGPGLVVTLYILFGFGPMMFLPGWVMTLVGSANPFSAWSILLGLVLAIAMAVLLAVTPSKSHQKAQQAYLQQLENWKSAWICFRCGHAWYPN